MTFEDLKKNLEQEKQIVQDMAYLLAQTKNLVGEEKRFYLNSIMAFKKQLEILNDAIPNLLNEISPVKKLPVVEKSEEPEKKIEKKSDIVRLSYISPATKEKKFITINKKDKERLIKEISVSETALKRLKKTEEEKGIGGVKASKIIRISNIIFGKFSEKIATKFTGVKDDLRKAQMRILISAYISVALFVSSLIFLLSLLVFVILTIINSRFLIWIWVPFLLFAFSLIAFYFYPAIEKSSVQKKISEELPFAAIYMAAIAGSNIEPTKIFRIIGNSKDYPHVGFEIKRMLHQIDIYGYDLVSALRNAAERTSNKKLSELFSGLATNIVSGGSLKAYLEKNAENYLLDYKLERQKAAAVAATFMDIYISVLIAAPLVLMMMFIVMNLTGLNIGLSIDAILTLSVGAIVLINIIFLIVLQIKQPSG